MPAMCWKWVLAGMMMVMVVSAARAAETTLTFATNNVPTTNSNVRFFHPWAERINEDGKGVIKIDVRDGTVISNYANYYDRVMSDVVQISWGILDTVGGKFARADAASLPFMAQSSEEGSVAFWRLYRTGLIDADFAGIHPLILVALTPAGVHLSHPLKSLDTLAGSKLIIYSKINGQAIELLGGAPLSIPQNEMYEAIQRGVADGAAVSWTSFNPFKLAEVTTYHVEARLGTSVGMVFMTEKTYDALSPAARQIIDAHSGEAASRAFGAFWDAERKEGKETTLARGDKRTVVDLTAQQTEAWRQKLAPLEASWAQSVPDGGKILAAYRAELAKLEGETAAK
jgi:TRAP-type transport system periplasmic protein